MPRARRIDAPGTTHHIMMRGVARSEIFRDDHDRWRLLALLHGILPEEDVRCLAWAFMPNHVHLLLRTGRVRISRPMARLGTAYAGGFNFRHERIGHLFQDRFRSIRVGSDVHLRWLVRYIHRNPLHAGLVGSEEELASHPWTGLPELLGRRQPGLVDVDHVLSWFAPEPEEARASLMQSMRDEPESTPGPPPDPDVGDQALEAALSEVCQDLGVDPAEVVRGGRRRETCRARALIILRAHDEFGLSLASIERRLGLAGGTAHRALHRARQLVRNENRPLRHPLRQRGFSYQATSQ